MRIASAARWTRLGDSMRAEGTGLTVSTVLSTPLARSVVRGAALIVALLSVDVVATTTLPAPTILVDRPLRQSACLL